MKLNALWIFLAGIFVFPAGGATETSADRTSGASAVNEAYDGLVTNQTVTVAGYDFYRQFSLFWQEKERVGRFALSVHERPSVRAGTQVWIEHAQRKIFQAPLPASRASIKAFSESAAGTAYQNVIDAEVERLLFRDKDMGPDEI